MTHIKYKLIALLFGLLLNQAIVNAQKLTGKATYLSDRDMSNFSMAGENQTPEMVESIKAQLKKQFQKEYELEFNLTESTWKEAESLDSGPATASTGGMVITIATDNSITYKNSAELKYIEQKESFSKLFLIKDQLELKNWKLTGETKKIGNYNVYKASHDHIRERKTFSLTNDDKEMETVTDTTQIVAWYTPDIAVPHGPANFWGLPGLILEVTDGSVTYLCTKVVINPKEKIAIKAPTKG